MPEENKKITTKLSSDEPSKLSPTSSHEEYEHACISMALNNTIEKLRMLRKDTEVDVAVRLLADLNDGKVALIDAERIHGRLQKVIEDSKVSKQSIMTSEAMARLLASILAVVSSGIVLYMTLMPKPQTAAKGDAPPSQTTVRAPSDSASKGNATDTASSNWQFPPVSEVAKVRSISDKTPTDFHLTNKTDGKIKLLWINYEGKTEPMGDLEPEQTQDESTFATHAWLVVDSKNKPLMLFVAGEKSNQDITVTKRK